MSKNKKYLSFSDLLKADLLQQHKLLKGANHYKLSKLWWLKLLSPRLLPVLIYRISYQLQQQKLSGLARIFSMINVVFFGIEISMRCKIGSGLFFPHTQGTVLGAITIGDNAVIYHGVTLGAKDLDFTYDEFHRPTIGDNVVIGAGAKVLGGICIGDNVIIGANSVVTKPIKSNQTVVGNPAKVIESRELMC